MPVIVAAAAFAEDPQELCPQGQYAIGRFAEVLCQHRRQWRRVRVEGHTKPPAPGHRDDWDLSSSRASEVAGVIHRKGHIESYYLAVSGRAGQSPIATRTQGSPQNERVEILVGQVVFPPVVDPRDYAGGDRWRENGAGKAAGEWGQAFASAFLDPHRPLLPAVETVMAR